MTNPVEQIRACEYLYLHQVSEPEENSLRVVVHEARAGGAAPQSRLDAEPNPELRRLLSESRAIEHGPGCRVFEIFWSGYIGYSVLNESYATREPETSDGVGRLFVEYTRSLFLEYLSKTTFADSSYPGPFKHWGIYCLNHCVEVASTHEPKITVSVAA